MSSFPQKLQVTHNGKTWDIPRDATLVLPQVGQYGLYADHARAYCGGLLLYHSREEKQLLLLLPDGSTKAFKGADIKGFLDGYKTCLQVNHQETE